MPNGLSYCCPEEEGGLPINLEELESANKVLMFNPEENGPAGAGVKGEEG